MSTSANLMGLGTVPALANMLGRNPTAVTCAGTASTTATLIQQKLSNLTAASSQTGAILPAVGSGANLGDGWVVNTTSSTSAVLYPPSGATINGASSLTVAQNKTALVFYYSPTVLFSILTA
jgi:hypothetical protein